LRQFEIYPPITVVIRTHNRLEKLKKCIKSVSSQYYSCNILVLNDGSTDNTTKWLADQNISFLSLKENVGPGEIIARGKHLITTPYYIILDDDDIWSINNTTEQFYNTIIDNPYSDFIDTGCYYHWGYLISTKLLLDCPNLSLWCRDDWYFDWIKNHAKNIVHIPINFYGYTKGDNTEFTYTDYYDKTLPISNNFYNSTSQEDNLIYINDEYHRSGMRERKVFDQIKSYYNYRKLY
jgi:glycosyltransferase involved in cell wall biosynthesis